MNFNKNLYKSQYNKNINLLMEENITVLHALSGLNWPHFLP